jgi:hypothetical protein
LESSFKLDGGVDADEDSVWTDQIFTREKYSAFPSVDMRDE